MSLIDKICALAKTKNTQELEKVLEQEGVCIDFQQGIYAPIVLLAQRGENEAVDFLIREFHANRNLALQGYAMGQHIEQVNMLLEQGVNQDAAVFGDAIAGNTEQVNELLAKGASKHWAVKGYAIGRYKEKVNALLAEGASKEWAVEGYAFVGDAEQVETIKLHDEGFAIFGYAMGEHIEQVNILLEKIEQSNPDWFVEGALHEAIFGYAIVGNSEQINNLLSFDVAWNHRLEKHFSFQAYCAAIDKWQHTAIKGFARGGYKRQVNGRLNACNAYTTMFSPLHDAIEGYMKGGHIEQANELLKKRPFPDAPPPTFRSYAIEGHSPNPAVSSHKPFVLLPAFSAEESSSSNTMEEQEDKIYQDDDLSAAIARPNSALASSISNMLGNNIQTAEETKTEHTFWERSIIS